MDKNNRETIELGKSSESFKMATVFVDKKYVDIWERHHSDNEDSVDMVRLSFDELKKLLENVVEKLA
jgi:hypothetical protein